jgi:hypothetical protein
LVNQVADRRPQGDLELAEELELALASLREQYRISFVLYHHQQLSLPEIAEICNCPVGTVKTWLHRARRQLAVRLAKRGLGPREHQSPQADLGVNSSLPPISESQDENEPSAPLRAAAGTTSVQPR